MLTSNSLLCWKKLFLSLAISINFLSLFPSIASADYPSVSELKDVAPSDWAYTALLRLIERYGIITGYPDGTFKGNRPLTRYEFATALNEALQRFEELIAEEKTSVESEDLATLQRLRQDFNRELITVKSRVDELENRTNFLEANQFSTTTRLTGLIVSGITEGGFDGDKPNGMASQRIISVTGDEISSEDPNATISYRTTLLLNTSFDGTDALVTWLEVGSNGIDDNTGGFLEPTFGSVLYYSANPPVEDFGISRLYYTFSPLEKLNLTFGSTLFLGDYIDTNSYITPSFLNFSTTALA